MTTFIRVPPPEVGFDQPVFPAPKQTHTLPLSAMEQTPAIMGASAVTTVTFYKGDAPLPFLRQRVKDIVAANPWLAARLVKDPETKEVVLTFEDGPHPELDLVEQPSCPVAPDMPLEEIMAGCSTYCIGRGEDILHEGGAQFRVVIMIGAGRFALVSSVSHVLADGHTYYRLHNMLAAGAEVAALERKLVDVTAAEVAALGQEEMRCFMQTPARLGFQHNLSKGVLPRYVFEVDDAAVKALKAEAAAAEGVEFVSTNDVLTSMFLQASQPHLGGMAINHRGRLGGLGAAHAGNYESGVVLLPSDFASASAVRGSVQGARMRRLSRHPLPVAELKSGLFSTIANWATAQGPTPVTFEGCEVQLHLPVRAPAPVGWRDLAILFRPHPDRLALLCTGSGVCSCKNALRGSVLGRVLGPTLLD